jgi:hypothetical protein
MTHSVFSVLCDITDDLDRTLCDCPAGPMRRKLADLVQRLDAVIGRTEGGTDDYQPKEGARP